MEVLARYGNAEQKKRWLEPLLRAETRSAFAMTEKGVASSDATNIQTSIRKEGKDIVINGHKCKAAAAFFVDSCPADLMLVMPQGGLAVQVTPAVSSIWLWARGACPSYLPNLSRSWTPDPHLISHSDPNNANRHTQQSIVIVPANTPGVKIVRPMRVMGYDDAPEGHMEIIYDNVRVPESNLVLGWGRGFEIIQGRLGPGRIHHW